jgi:hypothetical protein
MVPSAGLSLAILCSLPHTFGNAYALYAMKRDWRVHASKIDADALRDKNKLLAEGAIVFPTFDVGGYHRAIFANSGFFEVKKKLRDYSKSEWHKFLYLDDPKVKVKSLGNHARRQPRATNSVTDRRACIE